MKNWRWRCFLVGGVGLFLLAGCMMPQVWIEEVPPTATPTPRATPVPLVPRLPTPLASGRVSGKVCLAGAEVVIQSCCPPWLATCTSYADGAFAFEALTAGTFTVTCGQYSRVVTLATYDSQVNVDLCPPPTHPRPLVALGVE